MISEEHLCYMRLATSDLKPEKFIFYDFECTQEGGKHEPNFVVAHSICSMCEDNPVTETATCKYCGLRCMLCEISMIKKKIGKGSLAKDVERDKLFSEDLIQKLSSANG